MTDEQIVDLYWSRSEAAISETAAKYGDYCKKIAYNILRDSGDSEECVNDTYLKAWDSMPPHRPGKLSAFLGRITRNLSLDRYFQRNAKKRGSGNIELALDELRETIGSNDADIVTGIVINEVFNRFLCSLDRETRVIFMRRYWYFCSVSEIAQDLDIGQSKVKMTLLRARNELKEELKKEGIEV